jgi:hypothetical protein
MTTESKSSFSFRCPVHQSPGAIAHSFSYEPYISLKIDGVFQELLSKEAYNNFYPVFPQTWTKIEGELYQKHTTDPPILYVFYIESSEKVFESLADMYDEIVSYFISNIESNPNFSEISMEPKSNICLDILHNIKQSFIWRDLNTIEASGLIWFPKKYWKLNVSSWNTYIDQLDSLFKFVNSPEIKSVVSHDGLVISPNVPSNKKSLVKLKPKEDLTIDLFFNGRKFFSRERTDYSAIIDKYRQSEYEYGAVYRLAPNPVTGKFIPVYKREKGKKTNPDNIIGDILFKLDNYFEITQLRDVYQTPWYGELIPEGFATMKPVFEYSQAIYNTILSQMNRGTVLDIGCGAMGQYYRHFFPRTMTQYVGIDIDLAKMHESQVKVSYDQRFKFVLGDITSRWNKFNERFPNGIWDTYYYNMVKLNQKFDNIISVFSSQYANTDPETWANYVGEINFRSKPGTRLFIMWIDSSRINSDSEFFSWNEETNTLDVNLPHRPPHSEPGLANVTDYFVGASSVAFSSDESNNILPKNRWVIDRTINIEVPEIDSELPISAYTRLINWIVLVKI